MDSFLDQSEAISISQVSKVYPLFQSKFDILKEVIHPFRRRYHHPFHALKDVSFNIRKGETVGIIGKNGSGKSTLLKIICGVVSPTIGKVAITGKIAALLELGAGFNPEMTGRENAYFLGSLSGFDKNQIEEKMVDIIQFSGIGEFIDQPVKTYSSGMFVRLAFSVSINIDPDILIIDEALAVGDLSFQMKCYNKFRTFKEAGKTIIFVSHSLDTITKYCDRAVVLNAGQMVFAGDPGAAVDIYKKIESGHELDSSLAKEELVSQAKNYGDGGANISSFELLDRDGKSTRILRSGEDFKIRMKIRFLRRIEEPLFAFTLKDLKGIEITGTNTHFQKITVGEVAAGEEVTVEFKQKNYLVAGYYSISFGCASWVPDFIVHHRIYDVLRFEVVSDLPAVGFFSPFSDIQISKDQL